MSRGYDGVEPAVVDEVMLKQCVEEQGPSGEAGKVAKEEGILFNDVSNLCLDFKNILKVDNMWQFPNLVKLQLDNNIIEKIDGLSALVNLEWLDLSFNNIEVIDGLDQLTKLKDVTFFNNRISTICNMDTLCELQVLSIGNNQLEELSDLKYLRRFEKLSTLNVNGNPFCKETEYQKFTIAHLPALVYLDYRLIDSTKRDLAIESYRDAIEELVQDEQIVKVNNAEEEQKAAERVVHKEAYVEDLDGEVLFNSMFEEDPEASKLAQLPGAEELLSSYKENFTAVCYKLFEFGLSERLKRMKEIEDLTNAMTEAVEENRKESLQPIEKFEQHMNYVLNFELANATDSTMIEQHMVGLSQSIDKLWDQLVGLEMQLVDQLEESVKDFERNISDMVAVFVENVQEHVTQLREMEANHHAKLSDIAVVTLEKLLKNELEEEMEDDVRILFVDKDTIINAVSASHDAHAFRIDNKEDEIITGANTHAQTLIETLHSDEIKRNRTRITEINTLLDHFRDELSKFQD